MPAFSLWRLSLAKTIRAIVPIITRCGRPPPQGGAGSRGDAMGNSRIELQSKGRRFAFFDAPDLSSTAHPWAGYHFEESTGPTAPVSRACFAKTTIFLCTDGQGVAHRRHRGILGPQRDRARLRVHRARQYRNPSRLDDQSMADHAASVGLHEIQSYCAGTGKSHRAGAGVSLDDDGLSAGWSHARHARRGQGRLPVGAALCRVDFIALLAYVAGKYAPPPGSSEVSPAWHRRKSEGSSPMSGRTCLQTSASRSSRPSCT